MTLDDNVRDSHPDFGDIRKRIQAQRDEYFANFPYNEATVRDVIAALKDSGYFHKADFDPATIELDKILAPPTQTMGGVRILSLTKGPGTHSYENQILGAIARGEGIIIHGKRPDIKPEDVTQTWNVPENEVYVTIDDTAPLAGRIATYRFQKAKKGLKLIDRDTHSIS